MTADEWRRAYLRQIERWRAYYHRYLAWRDTRRTFRLTLEERQRETERVEGSWQAWARREKYLRAFTVDEYETTPANGNAAAN